MDQGHALMSGTASRAKLTDMLTPKVTPIHHQGPSPYAPLVAAATARK